MQQNENKNAPAFPPQVAQDSLGRLIVAVPGMTKREFFSIMLLEKALQVSFERKIMKNGKQIDAFEAAIYWAEQLITQLEKPEENETTATIIS
jgi:hypothetical protein